MRNLKLTIEYDGSEFAGWQVQPNAVTVQGEIERSLEQITREPVRLTAAGRTDAGVHASGQVANFITGSQLPAERVVKGGNALLPPAIRLLKAEEVDESFNARFDAKSRSYLYRINTRPIAISRQYSWYYPYHVDLEAMDRACEYLVGEHDFAAFCSAATRLDHYRCFVHFARWQKWPNGILFEIKANRFVHNMVRILVGTCLEIGRGKTSPELMLDIMDKKDRRIAGATVPPHGLCLTNVEY